MSYYPPNAEGGAYGPPAGNANQNQGPPGYGAPAPQQGYTGYPPASMGLPGLLPPQGVHGQQGSYPAPGVYHAPAGNTPAPAYGAPSPFYPTAAAPGFHHPGYGYPGAPNGSGYAPPMMPGHQGGYPAPGSYPAPAGNAHAYGPSGSQFPDNRAPYGSAYASSAMQGMPGQQGGYPAYHAPPGHHAYGAPAPFYPPATAAPGSPYPGYPGAYYGPGYAPHTSNYGAPGGPASAHAPPVSGRPSGVTSFSDASGTPVPAAASVGDMPPSLSGMSINASAPGPPGTPGVGAYGGGLTPSGEMGPPQMVSALGAVSVGTPVYGNQTLNNMQDADLSVQRALPTGATGLGGNTDANMPAAAVSVTEPNRCSCAPVDPAAPSEIPEEYEFISREGSLSLTEPPQRGSCGCHAADPHAAASIPEEYEVIPPTASVPVTQPPRGCSCGCHPADPATTGSRSAAAVGAFNINQYPAATSLEMSKIINILVLFVDGYTTDNNFFAVTPDQQIQAQSWWSYAKTFYKSRNPNLDINIKYQNLQINSSIKIPLNPASFNEAEQNWRQPAVAQWLTVRNLPVDTVSFGGLVDVNTLVEYTRDNGGPNGQKGNWAFVCFITNLPNAAGQPPVYCGAPNRQRIVQYYEYQMTFSLGADKNKLAYTHEMAHVFGAWDEYPGSHPTNPCVATNDVPNNNSDECGNISASLKTNCLMKEAGNPDGDKMCYYTRGQIGWPVYQPVKALSAVTNFRVRKNGAMSAVVYDNKLWIFYAQGIDNYILYNTTTNINLPQWASGRVSNWKTTQPCKAIGTVVFNDKLYLFFQPKDHAEIVYGIYDKNTNQWRGGFNLILYIFDKPLLVPANGTYISAVVLGSAIYLFFQARDTPKTITTACLIPDGTDGKVKVDPYLYFAFQPSDFGLTTNDICAAAVTVMRQTKKNASGVNITTQNMVIAYTQYTVNKYNQPSLLGVLSYSFPDGVSNIWVANKKWICNPNGPYLHTTNALESLGMLAICSSNNDFGSYYLAGVDNNSNTSGSVNRSSTTDLNYFAPVVSNDDYGFCGVANVVFNNTLVTFSGKVAAGTDVWYMYYEIGYGV